MLTTIKKVFSDHLQNYQDLCPQIVNRDFRGEETLIREYSGRVLFELFQNALDRCQYSLLIKFDKELRQLIVANDGEPVSVFSYERSGSHSDFHALLSLHDSTKSARESIGNKGVGFRSVFSASTKVEIWSRTKEESTWWGMCLEHPDKQNGQKVASFYCPTPLGALCDSTPLSVPTLIDANRFKTVIILNNLSKKKLDEIEETFKQMHALPTIFLTERFPQRTGDGTIQLVLEHTNQVTQRDLRDPKGWLSFDFEPVEVDSETAKETGLGLTKANIRIAMSDYLTDESKDAASYRWDRSVYWSYLPTEQPAGFGLQIHADFYLSNSRRNITFASASQKVSQSSPSAYNTRLLEGIAQGIVERVWTDPRVATRPDFWRLWRPVNCCQHLKTEIALYLAKDLNRVVRIFEVGFSGHIPENDGAQRFHEAMTALRAWFDEAVPNRAKNSTNSWLEKLREVEVPMVPVAGPHGFVLKRLPKKGEHGFTIYYRSTDGDLPLPVAQPPKERYVTMVSSQFTGGFHIEKELSFSEFNRIKILGDLEPSRDPESNAEILKVVWRLTSESTTGSGGRKPLREEVQEQARALRANMT